MSDRQSEAAWKANKALIRVLLIIWAVVSLGMSILFVEPLNAIAIGNLPLGFWMAQQGSILVFVVLIFVYAIGMDRIERQYGRADSQADDSSRSEP